MSSDGNDEEQDALETSLKEHETQLNAIKSALSSLPQDEELLELEEQLEEIVTLEKDQLLESKKAQLFRELGIDPPENSIPVTTIDLEDTNGPSTSKIDDEDEEDDVIDLSSSEEDDEECTFIGVFKNEIPSNDSKARTSEQSDLDVHPLACWEVHTKGIGSKLLMKMGYRWGQGLGLHGTGIKEPVQAATYVVPGKSLDHVMELKNGKVDSFRERKRKAFKEKKAKEKIAQRYELQPKKPHGLFTFLNRQLGVRKQTVEFNDKPSTSRKNERPSTSDTSVSYTSSKSRKWMEKLSDINLNITSLKVSEELEKAEHDLDKIVNSVHRYKSKDGILANHVLSKVEQQTILVETLKKKLELIKLEQKNRNVKQKLSVF